MKKSKQKQKSYSNWAANLTSMTTPARLRLPALITVEQHAVLDRRCGWCRQQGHNVRTCRNHKARAVKPVHAKRARPIITHTVLVARRAIALQTLRGGERVLHAAYDVKSQTLQVAFRGQFTTHWYAYANVPATVYAKLAAAKNPDAVVEAEIEAKYTKTYVHRRKMPLPAPRK